MNVGFDDFGVITNVERVTQHNRATEHPFTNYRFDFAVLSLAAEAEKFDWRWINERRDPSLSIDETL